MNESKTLTAVALLSAALSTHASDRTDTVYALFGPATASVDKVAGEEKTTQFGAALSMRQKISGNFGWRVDPTTQYGQVSDSYHGVNVKTSLFTVGFPVGLDYDLNKNLTAFASAGGAIGFLKTEVSGYGYSEEASDNEFGWIVAAGLEFKEGNFAVRAAYQYAKFKDLNVSAPMVGIGYKI